VAAHGGRIHLETAPGQGARFVVRLPLYAPPALDQEEPSDVDIDLDFSTQPEAS
jgi:hypothetical protein